MGRFTILLQDGSQTILAVVKDVKGRRRKLVIAVIVGVIALGAAGYGIFHYLSTSAEERVVATYGALSACLVGEPLPAGERPSLRFRAEQLTALTQGERRRAELKSKKEEPWPDRCGPLAHAFQEALENAGRAAAGEQDLAHFAGQLATQLKKEGAYAADLSEALDQTWRLAEEAGLSATKRTDVPPPPEPATAPNLDTLPTTAQVTPKAFELASLRPEVHVGSSLRFIVEDESQDRSPFVCTFEGDQGKARCSALPKPLTEATHAGFFLLGTAQPAAAPLVFGGSRGEEGVYRSSSGEAIAEQGAYAGHVAADGFVGALAHNATKTGVLLLRQGGPDEDVRSSPLLAASFRLRTDELEQDTVLLWNQVLLRGKNAFDETWVAAAPVQPGPVPLGEVQNVGRLTDPASEQPEAEQFPQLTGCRSGEAIVLRARHRQQEFLSFLVDGRWTKPVAVPSVGGTLSCRKTEATITRIDSGQADTPQQTSITQHRCSPAKCQTQARTMKELLAGEEGLVPSAILAAAGLDGQLLVLWGAGSRGGVRMRLAPASRIAQAPDVVLFDDLVDDGELQGTSTLFDARIYAREGFAIALLSTKGGLFALRIAPDGTFEPAEVSWSP